MTAAVNLASTVLQEWSGIPSAVSFRISYANQLTETSDDPTALDQVHITDLRRIEELWIDVEPDREWWLQRKSDYQHDRLVRAGRAVEGQTDEAAALVEPPPFMHNTSVSFRIIKALAAGIRVEVRGPDRTNVEGLTTRLEEVLNRSASGPTNIPTGFVQLPHTFLGASIGLLIGSAVVRWFDLAPSNNRYEWQEIVVPIAAAITTGALFFGFNWALPAIELLDAGERSRFARFRALLFSGLGAIIAGLIVAVIWAAVT